MNKNHEEILDDSGLQDPSLTARMTLIAVVVWELRKSQDGTVELSGIRTSFSCLLFWTNVNIEFGKGFYNKVVDHLISFPTMQTATLSDY